MKKIFQFKTNINCGGCIEKVKPFLDQRNDIMKWEVNTGVPEKLLLVETETLQREDIEAIVKNAGFKITPLA